MNRRGFVLVTSLGLLMFLTIAGLSLLIRSLSESGISGRMYNRSSAIHLADAGVDQAVRNLRTPTTTSDDITSATLSSGSFTLDPPVDRGNNIYSVIAQGTSQQESRRIEAVFRLTPQSIFQWSLFGSQQVVVNPGTVQTDSYDSRLGPYNPTPGPGYNKAQHGDTGTNATTAGGITLGSGGWFIEGQVAVGPNVAPPESVVTGYNPAFITGNPKVVSQADPTPMPPVSLPEGLVCSDLSVQGTVSLSPTGGPLLNGTYCYRNLEIQGDATLTASGPVTVYVTGLLDAQGQSSIGVPSAPSRMLFLLKPAVSGAVAMRTGAVDFYGAVYGPNATVSLRGNDRIFGSIVVQTVRIEGNPAIHYDEALKTRTDISNVFQATRIAWREL